MANKDEVIKSNPLLLMNKVIYNDIPIELDRVEKMILISLLNHNNWKTGICNPSIKTLQSEWLYKSDREVIKALKGLSDKKIFTKETIKRRNYYHLNIALLMPNYPQNVGNPHNVGNIHNVGNDYPQNVGNGSPQNVGTNNEVTMNKQLNNIYSQQDNSKYVDDINKKLEEDLMKKINSNYSKDFIKKELDKLKTKDLSNLDLLLELQKQLEAQKDKPKEADSTKINIIFDYWNSKDIIKHKQLTPVIKKSIDKALKTYSIDDIKQAINLYSEILNSSFYFSYRWSLSDFLTRKNGISTFMDEGSNKVNYDKWMKGENNIGNTSRIITKARTRFTEGTENLEIKATTGPIRHYTNEELEQLGIE